MMSKIWFGMSTNNILLLQKSQGHLQKRGLWMPMKQNSFRRRESKICSISIYILLFFASKFFNKLAVLNRLESTFCVKTIKRVSKWFIPAWKTPNIEFINLKHVSYTQPIWVSFRYCKHIIFLPINVCVSMAIKCVDIKFLIGIWHAFSHILLQVCLIPNEK